MRTIEFTLILTFLQLVNTGLDKGLEFKWNII